MEELTLIRDEALDAHTESEMEEVISGLERFLFGESDYYQTKKKRLN